MLDVPAKNPEDGRFVSEVAGPSSKMNLMRSMADSDLAIAWMPSFYNEGMVSADAERMALINRSRLLAAFTKSTAPNSFFSVQPRSGT